MTQQVLEGKTVSKSKGPTSKSVTKEALYKELELKVDLFVEGISFAPSDLKEFGIGTKVQEQIHILFDMDKVHHADALLPSTFWLPHGLQAAFRWDPRSPYRLVAEDRKPVIYKYRYGKEPIRVAEIEFYKRPDLLNRRTSDGEAFGHIGAFTPEGGVGICYSNECALKDRGEDCLYCNINSTAGAYSKENIFIKTPKQVGEVVAAAFEAGVGNQVNVTGGFVPERREIEYYADVAEEIKAQTGLSDFNGTAVIGAPLDFGVIDKYKEVGYRTIAMNIEIWDKHIFKTICPGKDNQCGGWDNWVAALERSVEVFGRGHVRSNIVAGIEPKKTTLEGVKYLAEAGVVAFAGGWCPNPGSELEDHRTPETPWHIDLYHQVANIFRKNGFTLNQVYDCLGASTPVHDIYRIEDEVFTGPKIEQWKFPLLNVG